jgi:hypothetical protein
MNINRGMRIAVLIVVICALLPLASTNPAYADSGKLNLKDLTEGADSVLIGTVTDRISYWNDGHTRIYTTIDFSVEDRLKGGSGQDEVSITVDGGEVGGIGEMVSDMVTFEKGERAVVFLKKLNNPELSASEALRGRSEEQFQLYNGYKGKFSIKGDNVDSLSVADFKGCINTILSGETLPETELLVEPPSATAYYLPTGQSWPHPPAPVVSYRINNNTSDCTGEGAAVQNAAATWSAAGANFSLIYSGTTTATSAGYDGVNEIMWKNFSSTGIIAQAIYWYQGSNILEADIEFNDLYNWSSSTTCPAGYYDVETIGLHELGHWVGLDDLYGAGDVDKVMYGYGSPGQLKRVLTTDDIAGIQAIYGATMPDGNQKLIGSDTPGNSDTAANRLILGRFRATKTGNITQMRVFSRAGGHVKVAVFADKSGSPGTLLGANNTSTPVTAGQWNTVSLPSTGVILNSYYWLAAANDVAGATSFNATGTGTSKGKAITFSSFTFTSNPTGLTGYTYERAFAGWGDTNLPPLAVITDAAIAVGDGTATLNGYVTGLGSDTSAVVQFEYGTDTSYGTTVDADQSPMSAPGYFSVNLSSLTNGQVYHFRATATSTPSSTTVYGDDMTFTPNVPPERLIGTDTAGTSSVLAGKLILGRFQATATGNVTQIRVYSKASGKVKVAIYRDNDGQPSDLLSANNTATPVVGGQWNTIPIGSTSITQNTYYWLAVANNVKGATSYSAAGTGTSKGKAIAFSSFTFTPNPTGLNSYTYRRAFAGWGNTTP